MSCWPQGLQPHIPEDLLWRQSEKNGECARPSVAQLLLHYYSTYMYVVWVSCGLYVIIVPTASFRSQFKSLWRKAKRTEWIWTWSRQTVKCVVAVIVRIASCSAMAVMLGQLAAFIWITSFSIFAHMGVNSTLTGVRRIKPQASNSSFSLKTWLLITNR